ncbi:isochorismatase family protein [uncultured Roseobacter sp.]|uniref:isochorismatase family protein n=1 Tax=uncultured Roseobacter sp. TaxID=114847 RepID=UPI00260B8736|nr:isochorismatase family protein [uncultured Roseobacter sp.]
MLIVEHIATGHGTAPSLDQRRQVTTLLRARRELAIPSIVTLYCAPEAGSLASSLLITGTDLDVIRRSSLDPWDDPDCVTQIESWGRPVVIVFGRCTEASLTFTVLGALERGYDVYLVADAIVWPSDQLERIHLMRMQQAGAVPISARQLVLEILRDWSDPEVREQVNRIFNQTTTE